MATRYAKNTASFLAAVQIRCTAHRLIALWALLGVLLGTRHAQHRNGFFLAGLGLRDFGQLGPWWSFGIYLSKMAPSSPLAEAWDLDLGP
jgi:hypothetical protein